MAVIFFCTDGSNGVTHGNWITTKIWLKRSFSNIVLLHSLDYCSNTVANMNANILDGWKVSKTYFLSILFFLFIHLYLINRLDQSDHWSLTLLWWMMEWLCSRQYQEALRGTYSNFNGDRSSTSVSHCVGEHDWLSAGTVSRVVGAPGLFASCLLIMITAWLAYR